MTCTRVIRFGVAGMLALGTVAVGADDSRATDSNREVQLLRKALADQVERNQQLEKRIKNLQYQVKDLELRQAAETRANANGLRVPDSWKPYQFNGMTVYIVPLGAGQTTAATTAK